MSLARGCESPTVNPSPQEGTSDLALRALRQRVRQQELLAELGVNALQGVALDELLSKTARLTAEGLCTEFCKILEYVRPEDCLLVRAGVGWDPGVVGFACIDADPLSPAGFTLRTGNPVISNHLQFDQRFRTPELLRKHGILHAMDAIIECGDKPFGVIEVGSRSETGFDEHDLAFLQGAADILGMAIEREPRERLLQAALARQQVLLKEMNHRVKNSLAIVASMLHLQSSAVDDEHLASHLNEASHRVRAIARVHDQLYRGSEIERIDVAKYIETVCKDLDEGVSRCEIYTSVQHEIVIETDRAISSALIVNELITNAAKYAYGDRSGGKIWVSVALAGDDRFTMSVRDQGTGLPAGFDPNKAKGLGMRIIRFLVQQLNGSLIVREHDPGTEFIVTLPLQFSH